MASMRVPSWLDKLDAAFEGKLERFFERHPWWSAFLLSLPLGPVGFFLVEPNDVGLLPATVGAAFFVGVLSLMLRFVHWSSQSLRREHLSQPGAAIPEGTEFRRRFQALEPREKLRVMRVARRGEAATTPEHAALVVAYARQLRRMLRWWIPLIIATLLFGLPMTVFHLAQGDVRRVLFLDLPISVLGVALLIGGLRWRRRLPQAEQRNFEIARGDHT